MCSGFGFGLVLYLELVLCSHSANCMCTFLAGSENTLQHYAEISFIRHRSTQICGNKDSRVKPTSTSREIM